MRLVKAVGALALLMLLLVGVPVVLHAWGQPLGLLDVDWSRALLRPDDGTIVVGVLSVLGWLAWAVVAATTVGELLRVASRGAVAIRLPGTGWLRPAAASLVTAVLAPLLGTQATSGTDAPPLSVLGPHLAAADEAVPETPTPTPEADRATDGTWYVVQGGDELWSLAERLLGSGHRWRDIVAANPGMSEASHLLPGERIRVPTPPAASAGVSGPDTVTVERGDTLWDLSEEHLGDPERWPELHAANASRIADPDHIDVGWELHLPPEETGANAEPPPDVEASTAEADAPTSRPEDPPLPTEAEDTPPPSPPPDRLPQPTVGTPEVDDAATGTPTSLPEPRHGPDATGAAEAPAVDMLGPIGAVLAAGIFAGVAARRRSQLLQRAVGRRVLPVSPDLQRFWTSLSRRASEAQEPAGMGPTGVVLGWDAEGVAVPHDLEGARSTLLVGDQQDTAGAVAAMVTSLSCAPWSTTAELVLVQPQDDWAGSLDDPRVRAVDSLEDGLADLQRLCAGRRIEMGSASLDELRSQPDLASAWTPVVHVFCEPLPPRSLQQVQDCLALGLVGVSVVAAVAADPGDALGRSIVRITSPESATGPDGRAFAPQLVSAPARRAVIDLFASATSTETTPAPWWDEDPLPPNVKVLPRKTTHPDKDSAMPARSADPTHPTLLLLGPVDLIGTAGTRPSRSVSAALEACAWLLCNPGATPSRMVHELAIAEATRRSNVSRLRNWLGDDPHSEPYLPDAYTGHLELHPDVTSDWETLQTLLAGGVNHASDAVLARALELVRGEPLAGVSFQWPWAEQLRSDMVSMVTDAAAVLADRALERGDTATAEWAIARGRLAAGEDETLTVREIHLLALTGQGSRVDQVVRQLTRSARASGRDLAPASVVRIQQALNLVVSGRAAT